MTFMRKRARVREKVQDSEAVWDQISEWMGTSDFGRVEGDELSIVTDVTVARDIVEK